MLTHVHVGNGEIKLVQGDIAEQETEAIVNAANNFLWMGSGVAGAIKRKGGAEIEKDAIAKGPIEIGNAVITSAGKLKAKYVIHAACMGQDFHTDEKKISEAMKNSLHIAQERAISSIAFPALGTGVGGFSLHHCAAIMIPIALNALINISALKEIRFVLWEEEAFHIFVNELNLQFSSKKH